MNIKDKAKLALTGLASCVLLAGQSQLANPGFETAGPNSAVAQNWTVSQAVGGPVYAVRTNNNPHTGSYNFEVHLASTGAGPVVEFVQNNVPVIGGAYYKLSFYSDRLTGSTSDNEQYNIQWLNTNSVQVGSTGYLGFTPGANVYSQTIVNGLAAPATAVGANLIFHFAGGANPAWSATIDLDDTSLTTTNSGVVITTNALPLSIVRGVGISWLASNTVPYQVQWASDQSAGTVWSNLGSQITGNGQTNTVFDPAGPPHNYHRVISIQ